MKGHARTVVGVTLSLVLLAWVLRDVSPAEVWREFTRADPVLLTLAVVVTLAGFAFRAVRWGLLLRPVSPRVPFRPRFAATVIGFAANNLLPARVGEFARALALGRLTEVPVSAAFAALLVERLVDGLVLVGLLFAAMAAPSFPVAGSLGGADPRSVAITMALVMVGAGVALAALVVAPALSLRLAARAFRYLLPARLRGPAQEALTGFQRGLVALRDGRLLALSLVWGAAQWVVLAWSYLLAFRAFGIVEVPFSGAVFVQSFLSVAVAIPSSPGFFGPFEAAARLGLGLWGVEPAKAVSFAMGFHIAGFIPTTLLGIFYAWRLGISWSEVRHSDDVVEERWERGRDVPEREA